MFLSPVSDPEAGLEHMCPHRLAGALASMGVSAGAGTAGGGFGGRWCSARLDLCGPWRLWGVAVLRSTGTHTVRGGLGRGGGSGLGPVQPGEALVGVGKNNLLMFPTTCPLLQNSSIS